MIRVLIIEDEESASNRLIALLESLDISLKVVQVCESVHASVAALKGADLPDLIFMDVHLSDGLSFDIFNQVEVNTPIIFITAYDEFALKAFKVNSVDYLLKPLKKDELLAAITKFQKTRVQEKPADLKALLQYLKMPAPVSFTERFVIKLGQTIKMFETKEIAYFYTEDKAEFLLTQDGKKYLIDLCLDDIQSQVDPKYFFRINRQFIIHIQSIANMHAHTKSRVKLDLQPPARVETIVAAERSADFKKWLRGKN